MSFLTIVEHCHYHTYLINGELVLRRRQQNCDNSVVYYIATLNHCISKLMSKYFLDNFINASCAALKEQMWKQFVDTSIVNGKLSVF